MKPFKNILILVVASFLTTTPLYALKQNNWMIAPPLGGWANPYVGSSEANQHPATVTDGFSVLGGLGYSWKVQNVNTKAFGEISGVLFRTLKNEFQEEYITGLFEFNAKRFIPQLAYKNTQCFFKMGGWILRTTRTYSGEDTYTSMYGSGLYLGAGVVQSLFDRWFVDISLGCAIPPHKLFSFFRELHVKQSFGLLKIQIGYGF